MIGAVVYKLKALSDDSLPDFHGQQLHGLCFKIFEGFSEPLSAKIHDQMSIKPFTSSLLEFGQGAVLRQKRQYIKAGAVMYWRVTALSDDVLQAFLSVKKKQVLSLGNLQLQVEDIIIDPVLRSDAGIIAPEDMVAECFSLPPIKRITLDFRSVTSFRSGNSYFPWPLPEMVFGSLADKWEAMNMPGVMEAETVRREAAAIIPGDWHGTSRKVFLAQKRGVKGFIGSFTYEVQSFDEETCQALLVLAAYGEFAGVGLWTAHGLGQVRMSIR